MIVRSVLATLLTAVMAVAGAGTASATAIDGGMLSNGVAVTATITLSTDTITYRFAATKGKHLTFDPTASLWNNHSPGQGNVSFILADAGGTQKKTCALESASYYCDITPDSTGTWTAKLQPGVASTGSVTFALWNDPGTTALTSGKSYTTSIAHQGAQARYTFAATAGLHITFDNSASTITNTSGGVSLHYFDPTGKEFGSPGCVADENFCSLTPNVSGTWTVAYIPSKGDTGSINTIYQPDYVGPAITNGKAVTTTIKAQGHDALYPWVPVANRTYKVTVSSLTMASPLYTPYMWIYTTDATGANGPSCIFNQTGYCNLTPKSAGAWTVRVHPDKQTTGSITFTFS